MVHQLPHQASDKNRKRRREISRAEKASKEGKGFERWLDFSQTELK
jgi:hypothetical protein